MRSIEVHARGECVLRHLKNGGYFQAPVLKKLFAPQHTLAFDSCDMSAVATGIDVSAFVSTMGWPNAGSYAAARTALGL